MPIESIIEVQASKPWSDNPQNGLPKRLPKAKAWWKSKIILFNIALTIITILSGDVSLMTKGGIIFAINCILRIWFTDSAIDNPIPFIRKKGITS